MTRPDEAKPAAREAPARVPVSRRLRLFVAAVSGRDLPGGRHGTAMEIAALVVLGAMAVAVVLMWGDPQPFVYEGF